MGANSGQQDTKDQNVQLPLLKNWEQKQGVRSKSRVLCMPLHTLPPKGCANHLNHPCIHLEWSFFNTVLGREEKSSKSIKSL